MRELTYLLSGAKRQKKTASGWHHLMRAVQHVRCACGASNSKLCYSIHRSKCNVVARIHCRRAGGLHLHSVRYLLPSCVSAIEDVHSAIHVHSIQQMCCAIMYYLLWHMRPRPSKEPKGWVQVQFEPGRMHASARHSSRSGCIHLGQAKPPLF